MKDKTCVFCKIVANKIPTEKVYEDDFMIAFLDIHPINPGHILVIPKEHVEFLWDVEDKLYTKLMRVVKQLGNRLREVIKAPRIGVLVEGWDVPHTHVQLVPLYKPDDIATKRTPEYMQQAPDSVKLSEIAKKLR